MKKLLMLLVSMVLMLVLVACGDDNDNASKEPDNESNVEENVDETGNEVEKDEEVSEEDSEVGEETNVEEGTDEEVASETTETTPAERATNVLLANAKLAQEEKLEEYLNTLHPDKREADAEAIKNQFEMFDLTYDIEIVEILEETEESVTISYEQVIDDVETSPNPYSKLKITGKHTLTLIEGDFKITNSEVFEMEELE